VSALPTGDTGFMNADASCTTREPVLRSKPDTTRPAVSTAVAAKRKQLSRYYVAELVRQGKIDGYGVRSREGGRVRWYVYEDALPPETPYADSSPHSAVAQELLRHLLDAREHTRRGREEQDAAQRLLVDAADVMTTALRAAREGRMDHAFDLLLEALQTRNDEVRRLLLAQQHGADAERCLDAALRDLLPAREEVKSDAKRDGFASSKEVTPLGALDTDSPG
jgi:hypothetical protein